MPLDSHEETAMGLTRAVYEDFKRWENRLPADAPAVSREHVSAHDVLRAHYLVVDHFARLGGEGVGGIGPIDEEHFGLLVSAVGRQFPYFGECRWKGVFELSATVFYAIAKNHIFKDANKRTALLTMMYHLSRSDWVPRVSHREFEKLAVDVARTNEANWDGHNERRKFKEGPDGDVEYIASYLRRRTRKSDHKKRTITYRQLDTILKKFDYYLDTPENNSVDIYKNEEVIDSKWLGFMKKSRIKKTRIGQIGFRGWTTQVPIVELKKARVITRTNGPHIDSATFFDGIDTLATLIPQYEGALRRLANK